MRQFLPVLLGVLALAAAWVLTAPEPFDAPDQPVTPDPATAAAPDVIVPDLGELLSRSEGPARGSDDPDADPDFDRNSPEAKQLMERCEPLHLVTVAIDPAFDDRLGTHIRTTMTVTEGRDFCARVMDASGGDPDKVKALVEEELARTP